MLIPLRLTASTALRTPGDGDAGGDVVGVGVDVVDVDDVARALSFGGPSYLRQVLAVEEASALRCLERDPDLQAETVARWFALKECLTKILDPRDDPWPWRHLDVGSLSTVGRIRLSGAPKARAQSLRLSKVEATLATTRTSGRRAILATAVGLASPGEAAGAPS